MTEFKNKDILEALEKGISKGKRARRARRAVSINVIVLAFIFIAFSVSVNLSGTLAASLKDVPVIGKIVDFVRIGSGYEDAAGQGYFADGDVIIEDSDFTVSVEGYYYSDTNLNVVLRLDGETEDGYFYNLRNVELLDADMNKITGGFTGYGPFGEISGSMVANITVTQKERNLPEELILRFDITKSSDTSVQEETEDGEIRYVFPESDIYLGLEARLGKRVEAKNIELAIDRELNIDGLDIHIKSLTITPVTMNLELDVSSDSMVFYDFNNIYFVSEDMAYTQISNGTSRSGSMDTGYTYYFKTNYFFSDEPLTLVIDGINALPEDNSTVVIDVERNEIIKDIDDNLSFIGIKDSGDEYFYIDFASTYAGQIGFSTYNGEHFKEQGMSGTGEMREYHLKAEKRHIIDSKIEIGFWSYPNEIPFHEEINLN